MSLQNAEKLLELCKKDHSIAEKFKKAGMSNFEKVAKELGFHCTTDEFSEAIRKELKSGKLTQEELKSIVVGGGCATCG